jgi:quinol monooxygenase YgiN
MELSIEIKVKPGSCREFYQTLQALVPTIRDEKGCRECRIYRDVEDEEIFILSVHWRAQASQEHYLRSTRGMVLLGAIDLLSEKAEVKIGPDARRVGLAALKRMKMRNRG